jgi:hypothetical protein
MFWAAVLIAHIVNLVAAVSGIDKDLVAFVRFMEKWAWMATFASYFARLGIRAVQAVRWGKET